MEGRAKRILKFPVVKYCMAINERFYKQCKKALNFYYNV